jgi:hypothetical protein
MGRLLIKFPTRSRPEKFKARFDSYLSFLSGRHQVRFVISMDEDDASMNNAAIRDWLDERGRRADVKYRYGHSSTKIEAVNADMDGEDGDVLLVGSDDMIPVRKRYDDVVFRAFEQVFPDFDGAIKFWDGNRRPMDPLMTLAVIGFPLYRRFGYIYRSDYTSLYADNEQSQVCARLGKFAISRTCIIRHDWTHEPIDALHARNDAPALYESDGATFEARGARGFDMDAMFGPGSSAKFPCAKLVPESRLAGTWRRLRESVGR